MFGRRMVTLGWLDACSALQQQRGQPIVSKLEQQGIKVLGALSS